MYIYSRTTLHVNAHQY